MKLTKKSETSAKITFTYDKPAGTEGYRYYADGKPVARTFNPDDLEVTFGKVPSGKYSVEALGFETLDRAEWPEVTTPEPTPGYRNPIGLIKYGGHWGSASNRAQYRYHIISLSDAQAAQSFTQAPAIACPYVNATTLEQPYWTGMDWQTASSNGWLLKDSNGAYMTAAGFGTAYLFDVGNQACRDEYFRQVMAKPGYVEGVFFDNAIGSLLYLTGNRYPAKYPNETAYKNAVADFMNDVGGRLKAAGRYVIANARHDVSGNNDGSSHGNWWGDIAEGVSGYCPEGWLEAGGGLRWDATNDWKAFWKGWANLTVTAQNLGRDIHPIMFCGSTDVRAQRYTRGTFMLDWDGGGGAVYLGFNDGGVDPYANQIDPYNPAWAVDLGAPTGGKTQVGSCWKRTFEHGRVLVNPTQGAQSVDGKQVGATDAYLGA